MLAADTGLVVLAELRDFLPVVEDDNGELERQIVADGRANDAVVYWEYQGRKVIVDGHRRYAICMKHNLPFEKSERPFRDLEAAKYWMAAQQCARRNLNASQRDKLIDFMEAYLLREKSAGRFTGNVTREIAKNNGTSLRTAGRSQSKAQHNRIASLPEDVQQRIGSGDLTVTKLDLVELAGLPERQVRKVVREVDEGEFPNLTEALTGKPRREPVIKAETNGKHVNGHSKPGKAKFNDAPVTEMFRKIMRSMDDRQNAVGGNPAAYNRCRDAMDLAFKAWMELANA